MKPQTYRPFTIETLATASAPELRAIAAALQSDADKHPYDVDYVGFEHDRAVDSASLPQTAVEAAAQKAAGRFTVQVVHFPRKSHAS